MHKLAYLLLPLLALTFAGCPGLLLTPLAIIKGTDSPPRYDILLKGDKRVVIVPRTAAFNAFEMQTAPQDIARQVNYLLSTRTKNKKLRVVEQQRVEEWLDNVNNRFDSFIEIGRDRSINADIVIGFTIVNFQIRDPRNPYLIQGRCVVQVEAFDVETGRILATETFTVVNPPNAPMHVTEPGIEQRFRREFVNVIAQHIAALFHPHNPHMLPPMDSDSLNLHR